MSRRSGYGQDVKESASFAGLIVVILAVLAVGIGAVTWFARGGSLLQNTFFAPKEEALRRDVFEQSKAYRDGAVQELRSMQFEYIKADPVHQAGLASVIRHKSAGLPADAIPPDLREFVRTLP